MSVRELDATSQTLVSPDFHLDEIFLATNSRSYGVRQQSDVQTYGPRQKIIINIPPVSYWGRDSFLSFTVDVTPSTVPGTYDRMTFPINSIFNRCRVYLGSEPIEDIDNYQALSGILALAYSRALDDGTTIGTNSAFDGQRNAAARNTASGGPFVYTVKLWMESLQQYWPLMKLNKGLRLELTLADAPNCMESDAVAPDATFTVREVYYNYKICNINDVVSNMIDDEISGGGYVVPFRTWYNSFDSSLGSSESYSQVVEAKFKTICRVLARSYDVNLQGKYLTTPWFTGASQVMSQASLKLNGKIIPEDQQAELANDVYNFMLARRFFDTINAVGTPPLSVVDRQYDALAFSTDVQGIGVIAFDLRDVPNDKLEKDLYDNGVPTDMAGSSMILRFQYQSGLGLGDGATNVFSQYEVAVKIRPGGNTDIDY